MTRVLVPMAEGVEEMEAVIVIDALRRAKWEVVAVALKKGVVTASRNVKIVPDTSWGEVDPSSFDIIVVPGGSRGVENLRADARVLEAIRQHHQAGKLVAAVCAGPLVLQEAGILSGRTVTSHPGEAARITEARRIDQPVVVDGDIITSQGAGTCFEFALAIIARVEGPRKAKEVAESMVVRGWNPPATGRQKS